MDSFARILSVSFVALFMMALSSNSLAAVDVARSPVDIIVNDQAADGISANVARVTLRDSSDNPIAGQLVEFLVDYGTIEPNCTTDANGQCSVNFTDTVAGTVVVDALAAGEWLSPVFASFVTDTASQVAFTTQPGNSTAGATINPAIVATIQDASGNAVNSGKTVTLSIASGAGSLDGTISVAAVNGVATFGSVDIDEVGSFTLSASAPGLSSATSNSFVINAASASQLTISTQPSNTTAGSSFTVVATLLDAFGNTADGSANVSLSLAGATLSGTSTVAAVNGVATFNDIRIDEAGTYTLSLSTASLGPVATNSFSIAAASASQLVFTAQPGNSTAGVAISPAIAVAIQDAFGNPVTSTDTISLAIATGLGTLDGSTSLAAVNGVATFPGLDIDEAGSFSLRATASGLSAATSNTFTISADAASAGGSGLLVSSDNAIANGSAANTVQATIVDANGNPVASEIVSFSASQGATVASSCTTNAAGQCSVNVSTSTAGTVSVSASISAGALGAVATEFVTGAADASQSSLAITGDNATANGSASNTVQASIADANGNPVAAELVSFSASNGASIGGSCTTNASGQCSVTLSTTTAGSVAISASIAAGSITGASSSFSAGAANSTQSSLLIDGNNATANGSANNTVQASIVDANGNPVSGEVVSFSASHGAAIGASCTTNASGQCSVTLSTTTAGSVSISASIGAGSITGVSSSFSAGAADASQSGLVITGNNATADGSALNTVLATITDAFGNPVAGESVSFSASNSAAIDSACTTNAAGQCSVSVRSTQSGNTSISATIAGGALASVTSSFAAGAADAGRSALLITANNAIANGSATNTVQATIVDANGNAVAGETVNFSANHGASVAASCVTGSAGQCAVTITSTAAGSTNIAGSIASGALAALSATFVAGPVDTEKSRITVAGNNAVANGVATNRVMATIVDAFDNPIAGASVSFAASNGASIASNCVTNASGICSVDVTTVNAGQTAISASIAGQPIGGDPVSLNFIPDEADADQSTIAVTANHVVADGEATNRVEVQVADANGNRVAGVSIDFVASNGATIDSRCVTDSSGRCSAAVTSTVAGSSAITASIEGQAIGAGPVMVNFVAGAASAELSTLTASGAMLEANGSSTLALTVQLQDRFNNPLTAGGDAVVIAISSGAGSLSATSDNGDGSYSAVFTAASLPGEATFSATVNGASLISSASVEQVVGAADASQSEISASETSLEADGRSTAQILVQLRDATGNAISSGGDSLQLAVSQGSLSALIDNQNGSYSATFTAGNSPGIATISGILNGVTMQDTAAIRLDEEMDVDKDGIPNTVEGTADTDGDGSPDYDDTDADNDGIPDAVEAGFDPLNPPDRDGDSVPDFKDRDSDGDKILDRLEAGSIPLFPVDTDADTVPDYLDGDSDNDSIPDALESAGMPALNGLDANSNGIDDNVDATLTGAADINNNGVDDALEPADFDGDGFANALDLDSDNDGLVDLLESGLSSAQIAMLDSNADGRIDLEANGFGEDGIADAIQSNTDGAPVAYPQADTDGDNRRDALDLDADGDGIPDLIEGGNSDAQALDANRNGTIDASESPVGEDGISDGLQAEQADGGSVAAPINSDVDNENGEPLADFRDLDSDNDGLPDVLEAGSVDADQNALADGEDTNGDGLVDNNASLSPVDSGENGRPDYRTPDSNGVAPGDDNDSDPSLDALDNAPNDGVLDNTDDSDGDGIANGVDAAPGSAGTARDFDRDGVLDGLDLDDDNDGILDTVEGDGLIDSDEDGVPDSFDRDSDNDGLADLIEVSADFPDSDNNRVIDNFTDANGDGVHDGVSLAQDALDTDSDGEPDFRDLDSDGDGISDLQESLAEGIDYSALDADNDSRLDDIDARTGLPRTRLRTVDSDRDNQPDFRDAVETVQAPAPDNSPRPETDSPTANNGGGQLNPVAEITGAGGGAGGYWMVFWLTLLVISRRGAKKAKK